MSLFVAGFICGLGVGELVEWAILVYRRREKGEGGA
jgi:hypothetical protein